MLFVASEASPFVKTGGLGDVIGSLPKELKKMGIDIRVFIPDYQDIPMAHKKNMIHKLDFNVRVGWRNNQCSLKKIKYKPFYFIGNSYYYDRQGVYGFDDDAERFVFFCLAVLESLPHIEFYPDIIHCHDWHTAPISLFMKTHYKDHPDYKNIRTVFTIHNLMYQGVYDWSIVEDLLSIANDDEVCHGIKFYGKVNFMKTGIAFSDIITTVSKTYAKEIQTPYFGERLHGVISERKNCIYGIINGIDYRVYNPEKDKYITARYNIDLINKKMINKEELQKQMTLPVRDDIPLIAIISRLVSQKGLDLITHMLDEILLQEVQLVVLGTGEQKYEELFINAANKYPHKIAVNIQFDTVLSHQIYAGADILLMPSLFEPCGLSQLIALRYGCIPLVRETGGLNDTVQSFDEATGEGNGFSFTNYNAHDMLYTIERATTIFQNKQAWKQLMQNAMISDCSWNQSAMEYKQLYIDLLSGSYTKK